MLPKLWIQESSHWLTNWLTKSVQSCQLRKLRLTQHKHVKKKSCLCLSSVSELTKKTLQGTTSKWSFVMTQSGQLLSQPLQGTKACSTCTQRNVSQIVNSTTMLTKWSNQCKELLHKNLLTVKHSTLKMGIQWCAMVLWQSMSVLKQLQQLGKNQELESLLELQTCWKNKILKCLKVLQRSCCLLSTSLLQLRKRLWLRLQSSQKKSLGTVQLPLQSLQLWEESKLMRSQNLKSMIKNQSHQLKSMVIQLIWQ